MAMGALIRAMVLLMGTSLTAEAAPCPTAGEPARLVAVDARLELRLADGRRLTLPGLEIPQAPHAAAARSALAAWLEGQDVQVATLESAPDRWNRWPARVFAPQAGGGLLAVDEALVDAGLVRVAGPATCLSSLLALEDGARRAGLGVWADPVYAVRPADQPDLFAEGAAVITEGRVTSFGETASRLYLNFGVRRYVDLSVSLPKSKERGFESMGLQPRQLAGHRIRVRGVVERRFGPVIPVDDPSAIELLDADAPRR